MKKTYYLLNEAAKDVSVTVPCKPYQIAYLITIGVLEEPALRINNKRIFTNQDVERIREVFVERADKAKPWKRVNA
jgi:DNA-binding transcriptional MerR regulator